MTIANRTILVAGANRGLGRAPVDPKSAPDSVARAAFTGTELTTLARAAVRPRNTALAMTLGLAATCWIVAVWRMNGMDMGVATRLDPFPPFLAVWAAMIAALILPRPRPASLGRAPATRQGRDRSAFPARDQAWWR